ncbi:MAG: Rv3235 family protein [Bifidobacterium sp.]|jgi:hypothetical protein|nr:Rv3235 family protein [Bifidobacterium sp.]MCH4174284.1 Rv3235 family protein [Bifidobacterium sp.]
MNEVATGTKMYGIASFERIIELGVGMLPVPLHLARCSPSSVSDELCLGLSVSACRLACMAVDVIRGRLDARLLRKAVDLPVISKLEMFTLLLDEHWVRSADIQREMLRLPVVARNLHAVLVSPQRVEVLVHMNIGRTQYWANVILRLRNERWVCTMLDLG